VATPEQLSIKPLEKLGERIPYLVLIAGVIYSLSMLAQIWSGSLLSVDSGLKYLMVRQYARGDFSTALHSDKPEWVKNLWNEGFFPVREPWVCRKGPDHIVVFPPLFQLLSTPFFMVFGKAGLVIIPLLSLWILWFRFIALCRGLKISPTIISLFLAGLVFGSPMTVYGVEFWEHTLGALLVFLCFEYAVAPEIGGATPWRSVVYGGLSAFSVWIRPESFLLFLPLIVVIALRKSRSAVFLGSTLVVILGFFVANLLVSGRPFGFHGHQVLDADLVASFTTRYLDRFLPMVRGLLKTFPLILLFVPTLPILYFRLKKRELFFLSISILFFFLFTPLLLPNSGGGQWGPRYYLIALAPVVFMLAAVLEGLTRQDLRVGAGIFAGLSIVFFVAGSFVNYEGGMNYLKTVHYLRADMLAKYLKTHEIHQVISGCNSIPMEIAELFHSRDFFYSKDLMTGSRPVLEEFARHGITSFYLVTPKEAIDLPSGMSLEDGRSLRFSYRLIPLISLYRLVLVTCHPEGMQQPVSDTS